MIDKTDLRLLAEVYAANAEFGMPYLPSPRKIKRARKLALCGLLKDSGAQFVPPLDDEWAAYTVTNAGVDALSGAAQ